MPGPCDSGGTGSSISGPPSHWRAGWKCRRETPLEAEGGDLSRTGQQPLPGALTTARMPEASGGGGERYQGLWDSKSTKQTPLGPTGNFVHGPSCQPFHATLGAALQRLGLCSEQPRRGHQSSRQEPTGSQRTRNSRFHGLSVDTSRPPRICPELAKARAEGTEWS